MERYAIGQEVIFTNLDGGGRVNRYGTNQTSDIPSDLIIHGSTIPKDNTGKIVDKWKDWWIIKYVDTNNRYTQLGFKDSEFEPLLRTQPTRMEARVSGIVAVDPVVLHNTKNAEMGKAVKEAKGEIPMMHVKER